MSIAVEDWDEVSQPPGDGVGEREAAAAPQAVESRERAEDGGPR